ncbi:MAG: transposase [Candidatus Eisenbacteria bacterium]|uniref:Transposase n=1 Tax=Eiseniibacteriota bacterium TaxID=2212470 RepID=A0A948RXC0_UNCEI|nr:transposase [Candidatus Eisenbacteria bacterium]MBU1948138.1 transposase [Candidatus Eisenbacteria bacterium]MBU2689959.1 transposase [Candidatus Eisenbacteria bacterium]
MERYIGSDVHATSTTFCVLSAKGKLVRSDVVETNGQARVEYLKLIPGNLHLCIDEGLCSQWLVEILSPYVAEILVYRARWTPGPKNDAIDARGLAEKIRTGTVGRPVYKDPRRFTALRLYAHTYAKVTQDVARTKIRLKSLLRGRGIPCSGEAVYSIKTREAIIRKLPEAIATAAEILGLELDRLREIKTEAEKIMVRESHRHKISRILETAPGMGPIRVAQLLPVVITPHRFRTKRPFWAYCGFGVVVRSSSDWILADDGWVRTKLNRTRGLNREYNHTLKAIFKAAATTIIVHTQSHPLKDDYQRLLRNGTKPTLAKVTLARKIAAIVLAMWKREERYRPEIYRQAMPSEAMNRN